MWKEEKGHIRWQTKRSWLKVISLLQQSMSLHHLRQTKLQIPCSLSRRNRFHLAKQFFSKKVFQPPFTKVDSFLLGTFINSSFVDAFFCVHFFSRFFSKNLFISLVWTIHALFPANYILGFLQESLQSLAAFFSHFAISIFPMFSCSNFFRNRLFYCLGLHFSRDVIFGEKPTVSGAFISIRWFFSFFYISKLLYTLRFNASAGALSIVDRFMGSTLYIIYYRIAFLTFSLRFTLKKIIKTNFLETV